LVLDNLATRYHLLPSRVLAEADTLDFLVMDVVLAYNKYSQDKSDAQRKGLAPPAPKLPLNTLQQMIERVKSNDC
jgi:hypothetical protein